MAPPSLQSRIKGSIFGVAVVDALGGPVEFQPRGTFPEVTDFAHNEHFNVPPGTWTDDTSMTLCLAQSLIDSAGTFIPQSAMRNYIAWFRNGYLSATGYCFDIGGSTRIALNTWSKYFNRNQNLRRDDPKAHEDGQGDIDKSLKRESACGNGSLMRVSPIGLVYFYDMDLALSNAALSSDATHPYPTCAECCVLYTKLLVGILKGATKEELAVEVGKTTFKDNKLEQRLSGYNNLQDWIVQDPDKIKSSGYVISTLEAALWAFFTTGTFRDGALRVVNLGYDADTVGAVYGGLAGAYYGLDDIPQNWLDGLQRKDIVERISSGLASLASVHETVG